jgi:hypothetical protein
MHPTGPVASATGPVFIRTLRIGADHRRWNGCCIRPRRDQSKRTSQQMALPALRVSSASWPHERIPSGAGVVTPLMERLMFIEIHACSASSERYSTLLTPPGVTFPAARPAIAARPNDRLSSLTCRARRCRPLAHADTSAELDAQAGVERVPFPLGRRYSNANQATGEKTSSALTLKDTCAGTVNVSVIDGLARDPSATDSVTRKHQRNTASQACALSRRRRL